MDTDVDTFLPAVYTATAPLDLDTFLVAVSTVVDTFYQDTIAAHKPRRRGPKPLMTDSEVLTLELIGQWRSSSERALLAWAQSQLTAWFPVILSQSAFNRRVHDLGPVVAALMIHLADLLDAAQTPYQIVDTTPVPLARQCRGERRRLLGEPEAGIGRGGSDRSWFYGCRLLLLTAADGPITGFVVGPAATQDRWLLEEALAWRMTPPLVPRTVEDLPPSHAKGRSRVGPKGRGWWPGSAGHHARCAILGDNGYGGEAWQPYWREIYRVPVLTPATLEVQERRRFRGWRQTIETINGVLADTLHLAFPLAKTMWGVVIRTAAKCAACNLGIWLNRWLGRPDFALGTLFRG